MTYRFSLLLIVVSLFIACKDAPERPTQILEEGYQPAEVAPPVAPAATPDAAEPPQNAQGVWHYTCSKGCAGGAGSAVPCTTCGTPLVHNTAYHNSGTTTLTTPTAPQAGQAGSISNPIVSGVGAPPPAPGAAPPGTPEPAQNAKGVWHYTCPDGCSGGSGVATACTSCGATLVHNQAYHN